ncbi:MAG: tipN [Asticcacaulis sp.]
MKSRRPPLNLSDPKSRAAARTARGAQMDGDSAVDEAETLDETPADAEETQGTEPADDILDAPLTTEAEAEAPAIAVHLTPPPETTPPVRAEDPKAKTPEKPYAPESRRDLSAVKVEPEGVLRATGAPAVLFWGGATFISLLWACGLAAFVLGAQSDISAFKVAPFRLLVPAFLAIFPVGLIFAGAFALRIAAALSRQAQRTAALADAMLAPAAQATAQATDLVDSLRGQVDQATRAVRLAHADLAELSQRLKAETDRLQDATQIARAATQSITRSLEQERGAIGQMSEQLGQQASGIVETVDRQARMVADASDLAQTQLREAEATLAARTADIMAVVQDVTETARTATSDLDRQTQKLETAGTGVAGQIRSVEEGLSQQRAALVSAALSLRADQEDFAVHIENQRAQLTEALAITRVATVDLGETSARGVDVLRDLVVSAQENFRAVTQASENERTAFETRVHATLSNISMMAADARDDLIEETRRALEQLSTAAADARKAADLAAQTAQARVDRLNETIFEASKKADEVFDTRFSAARRLIEDSAELIIEAGDQTADRLDQSFAHTRQTIAEVNEALNDLTHSAAQLPAMAQERLYDIRRSVEEGLQAMTAAARKAALETEAVDQAFQERVRRNYDMLTEAVRLMGVISGDSPLSSVSMDAPIRDYGRPAQPLNTQPLNTQPLNPAPRMPPPAPPAPTLRPAITPPPAPSPSASAQRLRLSNAETRSSPGPAPRPTPQPAPQPQRSASPQGDGWSWRDLLNGMEGRDAPQAAPQPPHDPEFDALDAAMIGEVNAMGVDASALLSRTRIEETINAIVAENNEGARQVIRRVAPAAIRRLGRRLGQDAGLRQRAAEFVSFYDQQLNIALMSKDVERSLQDILGSDTGRAYLLLDAALSEI